MIEGWRNVDAMTPYLSVSSRFAFYWGEWHAVARVSEIAGLSRAAVLQGAPAFWMVQVLSKAQFLPKPHTLISARRDFHCAVMAFPAFLSRGFSRLCFWSRWVWSALWLALQWINNAVRTRAQAMCRLGHGFRPVLEGR